jgi:O-antigen ligase
LENPLGYGTGSFQKESGHTEFLLGGRPAHSAWVKTLAENGLPGVLLLMAYIASFAIVGWHKRGQGLLLVGLFVTITMAVTFFSKEFEGIGIWFLAAWGMVTLHKEAIVNLVQGSEQWAERWRYRYGSVKKLIRD